MDLQPSGEGFNLGFTQSEHEAARMVLRVATDAASLSEAQGLEPQPPSEAFDNLNHRLYHGADPLPVTADELEVLRRGLTVAQAADRLYGSLDSYVSRVQILNRNFQQHWPQQQ
jgi:hypothetical protein